MHFVNNNIPCDTQQLWFVAVQMFSKMIIGKLEINDCRYDPLFQCLVLATIFDFVVVICAVLILPVY